MMWFSMEKIERSGDYCDVLMYQIDRMTDD